MLLQPPLGVNADIKDLERLWLECACAYEVFDDPLMEDHLWDRLGIELLSRRLELSPYFCDAVLGKQYTWPFPEPEPGENPLKTASGIDWTDGLPAIVAEGLRKERPKRVKRWEIRIAEINKAARYVDRGWVDPIGTLKDNQPC